MRRLSEQFLLMFLISAFFVGPANAGVEGPDEYGGHGYGQCEAATHLAYYDLRREGPTVYNPYDPGGDNTYYVDYDPTAGFHPDGNYPVGDGPEDCQGTPVLRMTAYGAVTLIGGSEPEDKHVGYPFCPQLNDRNPACDSDKTGVRGAVYVATPDQSTDAGYSFGVTVP